MSTQTKPREKPAGGHYEVVDRVTRIACLATTLSGLIHRVGQVRCAIGAVSGLNLREDVERWVCEKYPQECGEVDMSIPRKHTITLTDVIHGSLVMASFKASGEGPVDRLEAERRALICKGCQFNLPFARPCTGCGPLRDLAVKLSGSQGTVHDKDLHACAICHCFLQAAIWLPLHHQCAGVTADMRQQFKRVPGCWKAACAEIV